MHRLLLAVSVFQAAVVFSMSEKVGTVEERHVGGILILKLHILVLLVVYMSTIVVSPS